MAAELKISGKMSVKKLKENFKNEFGGTLRVYDGRSKADDDARLASIRRKDDARVGELVCNGHLTVGSFEKRMLEIFGIKVQVATPDDWTLALDGVTLAKLKDIPEKSSKADMEKLVAYKRKDVAELSELSESSYACPIFNFEFKTIDWELTEKNIEKHRREIDIYGAILVSADDDDDYYRIRRVIAGADVADGLYEAMDIIEEIKEMDLDLDIWVEYTTKCEIYGAGHTYEHGEEIGYVLSAYVDAEENPYSYNLGTKAICRKNGDVWTTDEEGNIDEFDCMSEQEFMEILKK